MSKEDARRQGASRWRKPGADSLQEGLHGLISQFRAAFDDMELLDPEGRRSPLHIAVEVGGFRYVLLRIPSSGVEELSDRERQIADLLLDGHSNKTIAEKLAVQASTISSHVRNIYRKLGVSSRVDLAKRLLWTPETKE